MEKPYYDKAVKAYREWLRNEHLDKDLLNQLKNLTEDEIYDSFYRDLEFGTGGLRGVIGPGTNRMNIYTVRRATQGFADYINRHHRGDQRKSPSVAIAFDSRINSDVFSENAAGVFAANGIKVYIYPVLMPTPALSFAVRHYKADAGIVVTASHNPAKYNGYKAYNDEGCQLTLEAAAEVLDCIEKVDIFRDIRTIDFEYGMRNLKDPFDRSPMIELIGPEVKNAYLDAVQAESMSSGFGCALGLGIDGCNSKLNVVYTPLNGAGNKCVRKILIRIGVGKVTVVPEQENPDGNFPTCPYPNPEKKEALAKGLELCAKLTQEAKSTEDIPDILLATDPDSDRVGIAVRHPAVTEASFSNARADCTDLPGDYELLTGNEVGVLLLDFICKMRSGKGVRDDVDSVGVKPMPERPITVKTIVTTKMVDEVAASYGVTVVDVLTGFKFIGEQIGLLEFKGEEDRYIFGFEESYGYLAGTYVRDKDAVNGVMLICEMTAYYKNMGKTLVDAMNDLYDQFGHYRNTLLDFGFEGATGMDKMTAIMSKFRTSPPKQAACKTILKTADYLISERVDFDKVTGLSKKTPINLPKSDVLEYVLEDGSSFIIRPSGTEPKIKVYLSAKGLTTEGSQTMVDKLAAEISAQIV